MLHWHAAVASSPWGNYDGTGGLRDGHYCVSGYSAPTTFNSTAGYWAGLTWSSSLSPAPHVFNFTALDAILEQAAAALRYVEINPLVGECAPAWLYGAKVGVEALIVNWKPSTACVPPICVPAAALAALGLEMATLTAAWGTTMTGISGRR